MKVLIIHAYSADNKGDGLLVEESINLVKDAFGADTEIGLIASYPLSFPNLVSTTYQSRPTKSGFDRNYVKVLYSGAREYDVIVSVGGGFLRGKKPLELFKTVVVNGPQLMLASWRGNDSVYLPQSIGPFGPVSIHPVRWLLSRMHSVWLRDDRSIAELGLSNCHRAPDLAILGMKRRQKQFNDNENIVLTVRHVNGNLPKDVLELNRMLGTVDSYVQSDVGSNSDVRAVSELEPASVLSYSELVSNNQESRVVIAVRLHAALMAMAAGHYVIHLAYERKGFGAFQDLGLSDYVYNVNDFDATSVFRLAHALKLNSEQRHEYDSRLANASVSAHAQRNLVKKSLEELHCKTMR